MNEKWTREETIIAFNVYCKIPFKDSNKNHPLVKKYAAIIGRSPSALNMKIGNLGRFDPKLKNKGITGLTHGSKTEELVWNEFYDNPDKLAYESECLIARFAHDAVEHTADIDLTGLPQGEEREHVVKARVNQSFFRQAVMGSYDNKCCISGISNPSLLDACHIMGWQLDRANRTNPENGLCLNSFFHRAYDNHLMAITPDYDVVVSDELIDTTENDLSRDYLREINGRRITLPSRFHPRPDFLDFHYQQFLARHE